MICIIDLGTSKVSSILIDDAEKMTVKAFSSVETQGIKKGSIINIGATSDSVADSIRDLEMQSGEKIKAGQVVNATGPRAKITAEMLGIRLPVEPRKRYTFIFDAEILSSLLARNE